MRRYTVETHRSTQFINVDELVRRAISEEGLLRGLLHLHVPHTTAGITINENADPDVLHDMQFALERAVPHSAREYRHAEGNSAAHVKASMMGAGLTVIVEEGKPRLGVWQSVFFCEFDGPRKREIWIAATHFDGGEMGRPF